MLYIKEEKLREYLNKQKPQMIINRFSASGMIISGVSLLFTIMCSDFHEYSKITSKQLNFLAWSFVIILLIIGGIQFIYSFVKRSTPQKIYDEISELDNRKQHVFNVVVLKNNNIKGEYLQFYSNRWHCKLFPNYKASRGNYDITKEKKNLCKSISTDIGVSISESCISYMGELVSTKFSYGDNLNKTYKFHFYNVEAINMPNKMQNKPFKNNGMFFCWLTLVKMQSNKNIMKKNKDVVDYVREHVGIA